MLQKLERRWLPVIMKPLARLINRLGISPNTLTILGFLLTIGVGYVLSLGYIRIGGVLVLFSAIFDALDGTLARMSGRTTRFGAYLDSTLDRFSEAAIYLGLLIHFMGQNATTEIVLIYLTIVGSLMVSYTRSRAESIGVSITQGLLTRTERIVVLVFVLCFNLVTFGLWVLAILCNVTALQRMWLVWQRIGREDTQESREA
ncbi:MAG: CDP-alcohol phosphatidyltransferase family protein [Chloroflexota bacterium]